MKTLNKLVTASLLVSSFVLSMATSQANELDINLTNIERPVGQLMLAIYDSEAAYKDKSAPIKWATVDANVGTVSLKMDNLQAGKYALMLIHDINSNGKMDFNAKGMPQDGYGFSNNVGIYGIPSFEEAAFDVDESTSINVIVRKPISY